MSELVAVACLDVGAEFQRLQKDFLIAMVPRAAKYRGTVIHRSLPPETEVKLQARLTEGGELRMAA